MTGWLRLLLVCVALVVGTTQLPSVPQKSLLAADDQSRLFGTNDARVAAGSEVPRDDYAGVVDQDALCFCAAAIDANFERSMHGQSELRRGQSRSET